MESLVSMLMAADRPGWGLLKVGATEAIFYNKTTMKFAESIDSSFHKAILLLLIGLISILACLRK
jgi:hypothetical protein